MAEVLRRVWANIDLDAVCRNYQAVRDRLSPGCLCMAVVKADAYGHGAVPVARELARAGADWFGVATLEEAIELRHGGIEQPILILSYTPTAAARRLAEYDLVQAVLDAEYADRLNEAAAAAGVSVRVHIKLDTGMSRVGFFCQTAAPVDAIAQVCALPQLQAEGIFTHFPVADDRSCEAVTRAAFARFTEVLAQLQARGITFSYRHCCNSAATLRHPEMHLDMVRAGIVLYGAAPSPEMVAESPRHTTMTLQTVISQLKTVPAGTKFGYGHTYCAERPMTVATLPIGYADGLPRLAAGAVRVSVGGRLVPLVGRICMDQCIIDVTDLADLSVGTTVTVFGDGGISADDYAAACGTIPYESMCAVARRVSRVYYRDARPVNARTLLTP